MNQLLSSWHISDLPDTVPIIAFICAVVGGVILTRFMSSTHLWTLPLNIVLLLVGALVSNVVLVKPLVQLNFYYQRPIVSSLIGITVSSFVILIVAALRGQND